MNNLSSKGIYTNLNFSEVGITDGLVGWWPLNGNANDISGNANNGTVAGATVASGLNGLCYSFDGVNDYINVPYTANLTPTLVSVSCWAYATGWATKPNGTFISKTENGGYGLRVNESAGYFQFSILANGAYKNAMFSSSVADGWHFIAGTFDGRYTKLYIDGELKNTVDAGAIYPITYAYNNALVIGGEANGSSGIPPTAFFNGLIEDVRIYNRALTQEEVTILYELGNSSNKIKISNNTTYIKGEFNELL